MYDKANAAYRSMAIYSVPLNNKPRYDTQCDVIRTLLVSPWLAKLTFNQSFGEDKPSSELRMRMTPSRYRQLVSNRQLHSRVRSMPPSRPQTNATTGGRSAAITDTVMLPVSTMVNRR